MNTSCYATPARVVVFTATADKVRQVPSITLTTLECQRINTAPNNVPYEKLSTGMEATYGSYTKAE